MYFRYGPEQTDYLKKKDKKLGQIIEQVGPIQREVDPDLFSSVVHHIVGQQISTKAQATIWNRLREAFGALTPQAILDTGVPALQAFGMSFRKAEYITDFAAKVDSGAFDLEAVWHMPDPQAIQALCSLKGIGLWTAEMILLFCMERPDVFSYDDLAIQRGCAWSTGTGRSTAPGSSGTAAGSALVAAWPACICGPWPAARWRV